MQTENLEIVKGDDHFYDLVFTDESGDPIDITGWLLFFTAKKSYSSTLNIIEIDVTSHTDAEGGLSQIHLTNTDTSINAGSYIYDIHIHPKPRSHVGHTHSPSTMTLSS